MARKKISPWLIVFLIILAGVVLNGFGILDFSELFSVMDAPSTYSSSSGGPI